MLSVLQGNVSFIRINVHCSFSCACIVFIDAWLEIIERWQHPSVFSVMEKTHRAPFYLCFVEER